MKEFKKYLRKGVVEMRPVNKIDIVNYIDDEHILKDIGSIEFIKLSVSQADKDNGSPKLGDMIARNPNNHHHQWLVSKEYFEENFEPIK